MLHQEIKVTGRESQGACHKDEMIGGKPPVVKITLPLHLKASFVRDSSFLIQK
jgi:hypothetical protein